MKQLLMLAAVAGLAVARPEVYREKEDFQFSRSSTDEGSKSGYYGAQRGNMGGNYERAHNMDPLAQNQMSGLVRSVQGELGDGARQKTGSVFTSANTRGVYGSGNYDLSNLGGRNFQEGESHGLQSHSSLSSHMNSGYNSQSLRSNQAVYADSHSRNSGYSQGQDSQSRNSGYSNGQDSQSRNSGYSHEQDSRYNSAGNSAQVLYANSHGSDSVKSERQFDDRTLAQNVGSSQAGGYSQAAGYSQASGYSQAAGYQDQGFNQDRSSLTSNRYGSNIDGRLVNGNPVRVVIRQGSRVVVPLAVQTNDASFDNSAVRATEELNGNGQRVVLKPTSKQYESSYSYRKEWEKHDTKPVTGVVPLPVPTRNPYPANSELYEDAQDHTLEQRRQEASRISSQNQQQSSHSGYNIHSASSSQSRQADYNTQHHSSDTNTGYGTSNGAYKDSNAAYNAGATRSNNHRTVSGANMGTTNGLNQIENTDTKPKNYHSAYSYHKSWERQGDPYVIKPLNSGGSISLGPYTSHQYISNQGYSSNVGEDCDEHGQVRVARSPGSHHHHHHQVQNQADLGQQTQQEWDNLDELGQQTQTNLDDFGQQTQNNWDQFSQQTESKWDKLQDEGQQTQTLWDQQEAQKPSDKITDFGQQTQNQWDQYNVGQQTQNTWDKLEIEPQRQTELGQQTQDTWTTLGTKPSGSDSSRQGNNIPNMDQRNENTFDLASNEHKHNTESHILETGNNRSSNHHTHSIWDEIKKEEIGQENEDSLDSDLAQAADRGQQTQESWGNTNQNENDQQKVKDKGEGLTNSEQNNSFLVKPNPHPWMYNQMHNHQENRSGSNQYFGHSSSSSVSGFHSQQHSTNVNSSSHDINVQSHSSGSTFGSSVMSLWDKLDNIEKQTILSHKTDDKDNLNTEHQATDSGKPAQAQTDAITQTLIPMPFGEQVIPHDMGRGDIEPEVTSNSDDIGRGDIEPENSSNEQSKPVDLRPYKNQLDIGASSIINTDKTDKHDLVQNNNMNKEDNRNLSVLSLDQSHTVDQAKETRNMSQNDASVTTVMNITQNNIHHNENTNYRNEGTESHYNNMEQQFENQAQHNLNQQTLVHQFEDDQQIQQANTDQQLVDFEQQSDAFGAEQMEQQYQNIQQKNKTHKVEELGQETEQFDQVSLSGWKPDADAYQQEHKLENWGKENFDQQSQSGWSENLDQQVQTAWNPTDDLQQQSQLTNTFVPEELSQQVQPAWNPTENLQQQSKLTEPIDLNQQVQTAWKPTEDIQQSPMIETLTQVNQNDEILSHKQPEVVEELIVPKKATNIDTLQETEPVTEKPSFWKSVGSKFTNAKDKVASWFSS